MPGHSNPASMKEDHIEGAPGNEDKGGPIKPVEVERVIERKFQSIEPNMHSQPPGDIAVNRNSPYHPVRRRGEAAAMIDIGEGKLSSLRKRKLFYSVRRHCTVNVVLSIFPCNFACVCYD